MKILIVFCLLSFFSCRKWLVDPNNRIFYFNSFENDEDASDWQGISHQMFEEDPAPNSGSKSLRIGGGCIQPTASITFPQLSEESTYTLSCWGKVHDQGQMGSIVLVVTDGEKNQQEIGLNIENNNWTFHQSKATLFCPAKMRLKLEIRIGGFVAAFMNVDCIKIEKV